jgi:WD40 repeat protein
LARYHSSGQSSDEAQALAVSPDGSVVFVTGYGGPNIDYLTIAYDADTGTRLWRRSYDGPSHNEDMAHALAVSPDGSMLFVTGESGAWDIDYATVAYDAATGAGLWVARYAGPGNGFWDIPHALGVSPDGSAVFVTGASTEAGGSTYFDYATVAYDAATGERLWLRRYDGQQGDDAAYALAVSPYGSAVFVTGQTDNDTSYLTVAYDAATGARLWSSPFHGPTSVDVPSSLGVTPDGSMVFVTGQSGEYGVSDYATVAYDAVTGRRLWVKFYDGPAHYEDVPHALGVSPDGSAVFVTGYSGDIHDYDYATVAYDATTGDELWAEVYDGPGQSTDVAYALGVSPDGSALFVTGESGEPRNADFLTIAYSS